MFHPVPLNSLQAKGFDETCAANIHSFQVAFTRHLHCTQGKDLLVARKRDFYIAVAHTVRDYLMARWQVTREHYRKRQNKVSGVSVKVDC